MYVLRRALAVLLAACLIACCIPVNAINDNVVVEERPIVDVIVYVSNDFSEIEQRNIIEGITLWETSLAGKLKLYFRSCSGNQRVALHGHSQSNGHQTRVVIFKRISGETSTVKQWDIEHKKFLAGLLVGNSLKQADAWLMYDRMTPPTMKIIAAHEFGHALGIEHISDPASIMSEYVQVDKIKSLTEYDINAFCIEYKCFE